MKERVGDFYVDTGEFNADTLNELGTILCGGEEKRNYPNKLFSRHEKLDIDEISLRDFLPEWIRVQRRKIKAAEKVMTRLGIDIPKP